ncbi:MAG: zeta toxin family protein [Chthoniobacterales bacterium]
MKANPPAIYVIAGPNGAGKTTFAREFLPSATIAEFLNADSIAAGLSPLDPPLASVRAARLLLTRWREIVEAQRSFGFESTLSGRTYATMLRTARAAGYRVHISYLALPTVQFSIRRVRERVQKGGHNVPVTDLRRRFIPSLANFFDLYLPLASSATLHDASLHPSRLTVRWEEGSQTFLDPERYERIQQICT